jgi:hypothetical protein
MSAVDPPVPLAPASAPPPPIDPPAPPDEEVPFIVLVLGPPAAPLALVVGPTAPLPPEHAAAHMSDPTHARASALLFTVWSRDSKIKGQAILMILRRNRWIPRGPVRLKSRCILPQPPNDASELLAAAK